jgi:hypothetical protein
VDIAAGFAAAFLLVVWGMWPAIIEARDAVRFARFKARVRAIWRTEICAADDIVAKTGEDCWLVAFEEGQTPWEAVHGVEF